LFYRLEDTMRDDPERGAPRRVDKPYTDLPPHDLERDYRDEVRFGAGAAIVLGVLLLVAIAGFVYFFAGIGYRSVANHEVPVQQQGGTGVERVPETTGSSANLPPGRKPMPHPR
jgi:hypothetical protein